MNVLVERVPWLHYLHPLMHPLLIYLQSGALAVIVLRLGSRLIASTNPERLGFWWRVAAPPYIAGYLAIAVLFVAVLLTATRMRDVPVNEYWYWVLVALLLASEFLCPGWAAVGAQRRQETGSFSSVPLFVRNQGTRVLVILVVGVGVLVSAEALVARLTPWQSWPDADSKDRVGPNQIFLDDGGILDLTPGSVVRTRLTATRRDAGVERGSAYFQVGNFTHHDHGPWEPLQVVAGAVTVTAAITASDSQPRSNSFLIQREDGRVEVLVDAGAGVSMRVAGARIPTGQPLRTAGVWRVGSGMRAVVEHGQVLIQRMTEEELKHRFAWTWGELEYHGETLKDAVQELSLFTKRRLIIADPSIEQKPVNAVLWLSFPNLAERFVVALEDAEVARQIPVTEPNDQAIRLVDFAANPAGYGSAQAQRDHDKCALFPVEHAQPGWSGRYPNDNDTLWAFDIPACDLRGALIAFREQAGVHSRYAMDVPIFTHAVKGQYTAQRALSLLLQGTGCVVIGELPNVSISCLPKTAALNPHH
jgi:ferric-dicitrate binding protein FerR (iron transport regulator)